MTLLDERVVVLITGIPAAGKSTVADMLARRFARGVHVRPAVVARREAARDEVAYRADDNSIEQLDAALRGDTPRIGLWLDPSDQTADETVEEIVRRGLIEGQV